jgi:hypothetical protein
MSAQTYTLFIKRKRWSPDVPRGAPAKVAKKEQTHVAAVSVHDFGVDVQFYGPDGWVAELSADPAGWEPGAEDRKLLRKLVARSLLTAAGAKALGRKRPAAWVQDHGVERAFGFPRAEDVAPDSEIEVPPEPEKVTLTPEQRTVVDAHEHFLKNTWDGDATMRLYRQYKKRLPAERRHEPDRLMDLLYNGTDGEFRAALEAILTGAWENEDWRAFLSSLEE